MRSLYSVFLTQYCSSVEIEKNGMDGTRSTNWERRGIYIYIYIYIYIGFWWGNVREREHLEDPGVDGRIILRWIFRKWDVGLWNGSSWLRIGAGGGQL